MNCPVGPGPATSESAPRTCSARSGASTGGMRRCARVMLFECKALVYAANDLPTKTKRNSLQYCTEKKIQPENSRKFQENSKNGRAPRAKRAAHAHFWEFSGFFGIFRNFFSIQYCTQITQNVMRRPFRVCRVRFGAPGTFSGPFFWTNGQT